MKKHITLHDKRLSYSVRASKRARRMRLAVYCDGSVVVTMPYGLHETVVERFIREKTGWLYSKLLFFKQFKNTLLARGGLHDYLKYKDFVLRLVKERVSYYSEMYGFRFNSIKIKNQKTRWGSCSKKGNLNFNYKVIFLPEQVRNYIIVHELCHLKEFNHSRKFWNLVASILPNYHNIKNDLRIKSLL